MAIAFKDLGLEHVWVIYPGDREYSLDGKITVAPLEEVLTLHKQHNKRVINNMRRFHMPKKTERDIEKAYSTSEFVAKLRRFADALETGDRFRIQIAGERISVPAGAVCNIEHEREGSEEEIEFQIKWKNEI